MIEEFMDYIGFTICYRPHCIIKLTGVSNNLGYNDKSAVTELSAKTSR